LRGANEGKSSPGKPNVELQDKRADVAQLVEQLIRNQQVRGSNPRVGSSSNRYGELFFVGRGFSGRLGGRRLHGVTCPRADARRRIDHLNGIDRLDRRLSGLSIYSATKAALRSFARTWTTDLKDRGIRVNVIGPGPIDTPLVNASFSDPEKMKALASTIAMGRLSRPEAIAAAVVFLASADASFITGAELFVDGGAAQVNSPPPFPAGS
jgi:NAD(P)-dependent dehydrogenase (short-subunit alcohol dehydrogenase family)